MTRTTLASIAAIALWLGASGCDTVETTVLIGEPVADSLDDWSGIWQIEEQVVFLRGEADGALHVAVVEWNDGEFHIEQLKCIVTSLGERRYVHLPADDQAGGGEHEKAAEPGETRYGFVLIERPEPHVLIVAGANVQAIRKEIEAGQLAGDVRIDRVAVDEDGVERPVGTHIVLRDKASLDAFISRTPIDTIFNRAEPLRLRRIVAEEKANDTTSSGDDEGAQRE